MPPLPIAASVSAVSRTLSTLAPLRHHLTPAILLSSSATRTRSIVHPTLHTRSTTVLAVRKDHAVTVVGDGQVTMGATVVKPNARKVRRLGSARAVIAGFAGSTADALALFERLELKIDEHPDQLLRACVSLAKDWRMDKNLRRLDATLLVCDDTISLLVSGTGDVLDVGDIAGIGSGSSYAIAAARALLPIRSKSSQDIASQALSIAADLDIYTNSAFISDTISTVESLSSSDTETQSAGDHQPT